MTSNHPFCTPSTANYKDLVIEKSQSDDELHIEKFCSKTQLMQLEKCGKVTNKLSINEEAEFQIQKRVRRVTAE